MIWRLATQLERIIASERKRFFCAETKAHYSCVGSVVKYNTKSGIHHRCTLVHLVKLLATINRRLAVKTTEGIQVDDSFVTIKKMAIHRQDISTFSWNEDKLEIQILMISGYQHNFCFEDQGAFVEAFWKLCNND